MGHNQLSAIVIDFSSQDNPSPINNMRCFILLALIAAASASCVNRVSTVCQAPTITRQNSQASSFSSPCYGCYGYNRGYVATPAPCYLGCGGYGYNGCGGYTTVSEQSSTTKHVVPATTFVEEVVCDDVDTPIESTPKVVVNQETNKSSSASSTNDSKQSVTYTVSEPEPTPVVADDCGYTYLY